MDHNSSGRYCERGTERKKCIKIGSIISLKFTKVKNVGYAYLVVILLFISECYSLHNGTSMRNTSNLPITCKLESNFRKSLKCIGVTVPEYRLQFIKSLITMNNLEVSELESLEITNSSIPILDLKQLTQFKFLINLSITHSGVKEIRVSDNARSSLNSINELLKSSRLQSLDLSHNNLTELPNTILSLTKLKSLNLQGNQIRCKYIIGKSFYEWHSSGNHTILENLNNTFCHSGTEAFNAMTLEAALKVQKRASEECNKTTCACDLHETIVFRPYENELKKQIFRNLPIVHSDSYGNVTFTLRFDCSNRGLEELPSLSIFTASLSAEDNLITNLRRITEDPNYSHVIILNLTNNLIDTESLNEISSTNQLFERIQQLELRNNSITELTDKVINRIFANGNIQRLYLIALGENKIKCDCLTVIKLQPTLVKHESVIKDWKTIKCLEQKVKVSDLKYAQVCYVEPEKSDMTWYIIIAVEGILIGLIIAKLWWDKRSYSRTGILPSCSTWIPRLPCDFMLEGIKDNHHYNFHHTSSTSKV